MNPFWILNLFWIYQHYFYNFTTLNLYSLPLQENEKSTDKVVWSHSPDKEICPKYVCDIHKSLCGFLHILYHPLCLIRPSCEMLLWQRPQIEDTKTIHSGSSKCRPETRKKTREAYILIDPITSSTVPRWGCIWNRSFTHLHILNALISTLSDLQHKSLLGSLCSQ